jgi:hypothetical protein
LNMESTNNNAALAPSSYKSINFPLITNLAVCVCIYASCAMHNHRFLTQKGNARGFTCIITPCHVSFQIFFLNIFKFLIKIYFFDDVLILRLIECAGCLAAIVSTTMYTVPAELSYGLLGFRHVSHAEDADDSKRNLGNCMGSGKVVHLFTWPRAKRVL